MLLAPSIRFVNLGIEIENLGHGINIFGFEIAFYGIIIAVGMLIALSVLFREVRITGQAIDYYYDIAFYGIFLGIIGARLYYVIFQWNEYKGDIKAILNIRNGGLAIYGGVLTGILVVFTYTRIKKLNFMRVLDTTVMSMLIGQIVGRWGNFFNREAFGGYTNNKFAMQIKYEEVTGVVTDDVYNHMKIVDGVKYIQVHPTFLYESLWNLLLLIIIIVYRKHKKFHGELVCLYLIGYGIGRFLIEGLRTDQLLIPGIGYPVSQFVSICMIATGVVLELYFRVIKEIINRKNVTEK